MDKGSLDSLIQGGYGHQGLCMLYFLAGLHLNLSEVLFMFLDRGSTCHWGNVQRTPPSTPPKARGKRQFNTTTVETRAFFPDTLPSATPWASCVSLQNMHAHLVLKIGDQKSNTNFLFSNSVQTRSIVKGEAQRSPLFWRFLGGFDFLRSACSRNSTRRPLN